ncbi:MAG: O-methyltransferase [Candidatus Riflebacteria bacterium]
MDKQIWEKVDGYFAQTFGLEDSILQQVQENCRRAELPAISISAPQGMFLQILVAGIRARRILEVGTLGGYSGIWLARGMPEEGRLVTVEYEAKHAGVAQSNFALAGLDRKIQLINDSGSRALKQMIENGEPAFDLIFLDADKPGYAEYLELSLKLAHSGTVIVADNVVRNGEVANPECEEERVVGIKRYLQAAAASPQLLSTALQTVGSKGYDGFSISIVK